MGRSTTSLRLDDELRERLARRAELEDLSVTALVERLLTQGLAMIEHPGIIFNPGPTGWRAAVLGAADVWEIVGDLRRWPGSEAERVAGLAKEMSWSPQKIVIALDYAADYPDEIQSRIRANDDAWEEAERLAKARQSLLT